MRLLSPLCFGFLGLIRSRRRLCRPQRRKVRPTSLSCVFHAWLNAPARFWGRIVKVVPPSATSSPTTSTKRPRASSSAHAAPPPPTGKIHNIGEDLKTPIETVNSKDDPTAYVYQLHMIDEANSNHSNGNAERPARPPGSVVDVQSSSMRCVQRRACYLDSADRLRADSRDRLAFSKSILRRFIRDCVDRDAAIASPWTVKRTLAERYGVEIDMPEATRKGVEEIKRGEIDKRRKVATPPSKSRVQLCFRRP